MVESDRNSIQIICTDRLPDEDINEVIYGIEEEGCNCAVQRVQNIVSPAGTSSVVAVVLDNTRCYLVVSDIQPPVTLLEDRINKSSLRQIGKNAGRYMKGMKLEI